MKTNPVTSRKVSSGSVTSRPQAGAVSVKCSLDDVRKKAFELSTEHKSYDEYIWLLAESEVKFSKACLEASEKPGDVTKIDPSRIVDKVDAKEVRQLAEKYAMACPKVQDLHWYIAERQCAIDSARNSG